LHRSEQNGRKGFPSQEIDLRQQGHLMFFGVFGVMVRVILE
jgi:hypothetical protein